MVERLSPPSTDYATDWGYAFGRPPASASLKTTPEEFVVEELLGFSPSGEGEHLWLTLRKRGVNTHWLGQQLQRFAGLRGVDVGYAGMKDRHGLTTQTFSLNFSGRSEPDWSQFRCEGVELLDRVRHSRKLKRGQLLGNRFTITLTAIDGVQQALEMRLQQIREQGVPNYFGEQRFGHHAANIGRAEAMFSGKLRIRDRNQRGIYLSAARSWLFNQLLSQRVIAGNWNRLLEGDLPLYDRCSRPLLPLQAGDERLQNPPPDLHPSGPLWGDGPTPAQGEPGAWEKGLQLQAPSLCRGLEAARLEQERRALRLLLPSLQWEWLQMDRLRLCFELPAGCYATTVLRELVVIHLLSSGRSE
ncbi:MAG: tRNA pseudouridine(13) synthase TruD [Gammaproteobacteria bacterium]|nr:tRNA pseudouridine(13) synthase TruD [Gammaproteobacteria bacterium]